MLEIKSNVKRNNKRYVPSVEVAVKLNIVPRSGRAGGPGNLSDKSLALLCFR